MVSAVVGVPAVAVVPTIVNISSIGVPISFGVLLLSAFSDVPVLFCAGVDPISFVEITPVDVSGCVWHPVVGINQSLYWESDGFQRGKIIAL